MTRRAAISEAMLKLAATVANANGVTVEIERNGMIVKIAPANGIASKREVRL